MNYRSLYLLLISVLPLLCSFDFQDDTLKDNSKRERKSKLIHHGKWYFFANNAKECLDDKNKIQEALEWIDHSLDIEINHLNLEIKGDYYVKIGDLQEAIIHYQKAILFDKEEYDEEKDKKRVQKKLTRIRNRLK
ncbi:tetratricopeptide repeat protein [Flammeovirga sp. SubArs3]|uniref:tetratricopeptide repeat protein n=1 Tax=Flammeovirga sp. SubArs3 TaxID=2995316 RepID=UPI00248C9AE7|nr:tetratricopeptide repeat protein [Flammeovirga sp. SubArs3]